MMFPYLTAALGNLFRKPSAEQFPDPEKMGMPRYRGRISFDADKCVDCGMCIKVCAPMAITREEEETEGGTNIRRSFNMTSCTFCAFCQDFCGTKAIQLTPDYHMVAEDPNDLITVGTTFKKRCSDSLPVILITAYTADSACAAVLSRRSLLTEHQRHGLSIMTSV